METRICHPSIIIKQTKIRLRSYPYSSPTPVSVYSFAIIHRDGVRRFRHHLRKGGIAALRLGGPRLVDIRFHRHHSQLLCEECRGRQYDHLRGRGVFCPYHRAGDDGDYDLAHPVQIHCGRYVESPRSESTYQFLTWGVVLSCNRSQGDYHVLLYLHALDNVLFDHRRGSCSPTERAVPIFCRRSKRIDFLVVYFFTG